MTTSARNDKDKARVDDDAPWMTEEHAMLGDMVRRFLAAELTPNIERWENKDLSISISGERLVTWVCWVPRFLRISADPAATTVTISSRYRNRQLLQIPDEAPSCKDFAAAETSRR